MSRSTDQILEEILAWTKFANLQALKGTLQATLTTKAAFDAYEASDGSMSQTEVARTVGGSQQNVSRLWAQWRRLGLLMGEEGKGTHLARPTDLGLTPPEK